MSESNPSGLGPGTAAPAQGAQACPRCHNPMATIRLPSHRPLPVLADHCVDCRLVWFDAMESIQLDGLGWTRLLRAMEAGRQRALPAVGDTRPACLQCHQPLRLVHNRTRFGRFSVLECPQGHGHLQSHTGLLAERGLVRPLGQAERRALRLERHPLHCFNCGGPAQEGVDDCPWCGTPLVVVDLPRLTHSLRLRLDRTFGASPDAVGHRQPWPCRGCGAPLDATQETACGHCGHLVVAHELPDLLPLLESAEADLSAAAQAAPARGTEPGRPAQAAHAESNAPIRTRRSRPLGRAARMQAWLPLWTLVLLAAVLLIAAGAKPLDRPDLQRLWLQPVGHDPAGSWTLVAWHDQLAGSEASDSRLLRVALFDLHLRQSLGQTWDQRATVGSLIQRSREQPVDARGLAARWALFHAGAWEIQPGGSALPSSVSEQEPRWRPQAPGLWADAQDQQGLWRLSLRNRTAQAMPLQAAALRSATSARSGLPWRCTPHTSEAPPGKGVTLRWVEPGGTAELLCRSALLLHLSEGSWQALVQHLRRGESPPLEWDLSDRTTQAIQLVPQRWQADARERAQAQGRPLQGQASPAPTPQQRWALASPAQRVLALLGLLGLACAAYSAAAVVLGFATARALWLVAAAPLAWWGGHGEGAASVLLVGILLVVALCAGLICEWMARLYAGWRRRLLGV